MTAMDPGLQGDQCDEHLRADVDSQCSQHEHGDDRDRRDHPPRNAHAEDVVERRTGLGPQQAVGADLQQVVGHDREHGGGEPGHSPEGMSDVDEEAAGPLDVRRHRGETDREDDQDDAGQQVRARHADAADGQRDRGDTGHDRQRRGRRDDRRRHADRADRVRPQGRGRRWCGARRRGGGGVCGHGDLDPVPECGSPSIIVD
ncbi:hypothetical protein ACWEIJ_20610 [Lentzea sp. NPDC004789]